jgi:hypothetical protein
MGIFFKTMAKIWSKAPKKNNKANKLKMAEASLPQDDLHVLHLSDLHLPQAISLFHRGGLPRVCGATCRGNINQYLADLSDDSY